MTAINETETAAAEAQEARQTAKAKTSIQNEKEDGLVKILTQLAAYFESVAGDDETLILSAGFDTREKPTAGKGTTGEPEALAPSREITMAKSISSGTRYSGRRVTSLKKVLTPRQPPVGNTPACAPNQHSQ